MFKKLPFVLLFVLAAIAITHNHIPTNLFSICYALSLSIKSFIIFILPFVIFMLLFKTTAELSSKATKIILLLLAGVCCSNFISTLISYVIGSGIYHLDLSLSLPKQTSSLAPAWHYTIPKLIGNDVAMFSGLFLGIVLSLLKPSLASSIALRFSKYIAITLKLILCLVPVFVIGFIGKLIYDKVIQNILVDYALIFVLVALAQYAYIFTLFFISSNFSVKEFLSKVKNMMPAAITGFGSMSSAAALPLTLIGAEKNTNHSSLTRLVIPTTVNIHLIGDCFAIPIFAFAILKSFGLPDPSFLTYITFALYFVLAKFSVAAIPGGGIIVMLPILEAQLGFTGEMASLITALYILFDPIITSANVSGNGAFANLIYKISTLKSSKSKVVA